LSILRSELRNALSFHTELESSSSSSDYESDNDSTLDVIEQTIDASEVVKRTNSTPVAEESCSKQQTAASSEKKTSIAASLGLDLNALSKQQIANLLPPTLLLSLTGFYRWLLLLPTTHLGHRSNKRQASHGS
jgi:hypothetical protein